LSQVSRKWLFHRSEELGKSQDRRLLDEVRGATGWAVRQEAHP
jgi:hypothetical protein